MVLDLPATAAAAAVQADLSDLDAHFAPAFPEEVDLLPVAAHVYDKALLSAVKKYVEASPEKNFTREHKELAVAVQNLDGVLDALKVRQPRLDVQTLLHDHVVAWISSVVCTEKWEPVSATKNALFSFSIVGDLRAAERR